MLLDAGRVPHVAQGPWCGAMHGVAAPAHLAVPAALIEKTREYRGFDGFKAVASTLLFGGFGGMDAATATAYIGSPFLAQHLRSAVLSCLGPIGFSRCVIRADFWIATSPNSGIENDEDFVDVGGVEYQVPYIIRLERVVVATAQQLLAYMNQMVTRLQTFIDNLPANNGSSRTLESFIGAHVYATPTNMAAPVSGFIAGSKITGPGITDWGANDGLCFIRSIMTAMDPFIHARSSASIVRLVAYAREAATKDSYRMSVCTPAQCGDGVSRLEAVGRAISELTERSYYGGIVSLVTPREMDASKISRRASTVYEALQRALAGTHPTVDFSDPVFRGPFEITEESIEFVRSKLPPNVKLQVWGRGATGIGAALDYAAPGANWQFIANGGAVMNILCIDGHAAVLSSVSAYNAQLTKTNRRTICPLCGFGVPHSTGASVVSSATKLFEHILAGCSEGGGVAAPLPGLADVCVRRMLSPREVRARFRAMSFTLMSSLNSTVHVSSLAAIGTGWAPYAFWDESQMSRWHSTRMEFSASRSVQWEKAYSNLDMASALTSRLTPGSAEFDRADNAVRLLLSPATLEALVAQNDNVWPREFDTVEAASRESVCFLCMRALSEPSHWQWSGGKFYDSDGDDVGYEVSSVEALQTGRTLISDPYSGCARAVHGFCKSLLATSRAQTRELSVFVSNSDLLADVASIVCLPEFVDGFLGGVLPRLIKSKNGIRGVAVRIGKDYAVRFRCIPAGLVKPGVVGDDAANSVVQWADRELANTRLWPLVFESDVAYSRAALIDSQPPSLPSISVLVSGVAMAQYDRMSRGGRVLTGCAVWHEPISADRRRVRLNLDFTAMYPSMVIQFPMPSEEHTDALIADFSDRLADGIRFIQSYDVTDPASLVARVIISGEFPAATHEALRQFPPLFSKIPVPASYYTDFQRARMGMPIDSSPQTRSVCHLLPVVDAVLFVREAQVLLRLGFQCSKIGEVRGCNGSFWARNFMQTAETRRRSAQAAGDAVAAEAAKRLVNSVIGAMNMNVSAYTTLKGIKSETIDPGTLEAVGEGGVTEKRTRTDAPVTKRSYRRRLADDPSFTGRVFTCGAGTYVEFAAKTTKHTQSTAFSLAVQAYARCRHLELWYGDGCGFAGIVGAFPDAKVLYGNTDSLMIEVALSDADIAAGWTDARVKLLSVCGDWFDLSNVPRTSSLFVSDRLPARFLDADFLKSRAGQWGLVKEVSGWAGYEAVVVNGPNRCGMRVLQCSDTLPEHVVKSDTLKSLRSDAAMTATLEEYAEDWRREGSAKRVCRWGNRACLVSSEGLHFPFGYKA